MMWVMLVAIGVCFIANRSNPPYPRNSNALDYLEGGSAFTACLAALGWIVEVMA